MNVTLSENNIDDKKIGRLVTFEGGDGSGKTTQLALLEQRLIDNRIEVLRTREPGGTNLGEALRQLLLGGEFSTDPDTEMLILFAARSHNLSTTILPALKTGRWVLCDRFTDATFAYQGGGGGLNPKSILQLEKFVQKGVQPDLTLLLDLPVTEGLTRVTKRGENPDRFEKLGKAFKERVRQVYLARQREEPLRIRLIDASNPIQAVHQLIWNHVSKLL